MTDRLARGMALLGGGVLLVLIAMICLSAAGNAAMKLGQVLADSAPNLSRGIAALGVGPLKAVYELVEVAIAFVIFAFLPLAQTRRAHAVVGVFTARLGVRAEARLERVWHVLMALALVLIAWRLGAGTLTKMRNGETTFLLQVPLWWAYAASLLAAVVAALVAVLIALRGGAPSR